MILTTVFTLIFFFSRTTSAAKASINPAAQCSLDIQTSLNTKNEPLVLKVEPDNARSEHSVRLDIARPEVRGTNGVINVQNKGKIKMACPGFNSKSKKQNTFADSTDQSVDLECKNGVLTLPSGKEMSSETLSCSNSVASSWLKMDENQKCGSGEQTGFMNTLGFELNDKSWFPEIKICHNQEKGVSYWASHHVYGHSIKGSIKSNDRKNFARGDKTLFKGTDPNARYTKKNQKTTFDSILGKGKGDSYITDNVYLARGHLAPDADFIFFSEQMLTYYYVNTAPQWQPFNAGNWLLIENTVRDLAAKSDATINVYTGIYNILKLEDTSGNLQEIYLEKTKKMIPVPEVFWKVVEHSVTHSCTVIIGHNNVHLEKDPEPICDTYLPDGWPTKGLNETKKGYTYYCNYRNFKSVVDFAPDIECKDLFEFPEVKE